MLIFIILIILIIIIGFVKVYTFIGSGDNICIFWFRRDFRLEDNLALYHASKYGKILPIFIFDDKQIDSKQNEFFSSRSFAFMLSSLKELAEQIKQKKGKLIFKHGNPKEILKSLYDKYNAPIFYNIDYTPFARSRDSTVDKLMETYPYDGQTMLYIDKPYKKFTPFYEYYKHKVRELVPKISLEFVKPKNEHSDTSLLSDISTDGAILRGGRKEALSLLQNMKNKEYPQKNMEQNSLLSAHLKYGTVSIREVYEEISNEPFRRQLFWREFYYQVAQNDPNCLAASYYPQNVAQWENNKEYFKRWCDGTTGFPIIDAAMTQLNETGFIHNRGRLLVADFLIKILHIGWRWGEKYFAQNLIDYDPIINNYNWQWVAGTAPFSQPKFRVFNPERQTEKYDPQGEYVIKWKRFNGAPIVDYENEKNKYLKSIK